MQAFNIQSNEKEVVIRFDKSDMSTEILLKIAKRLQVEYLAQKAGFNKEILPLSEEIDNQWWKKNGEDFLKNVKK